MGTQTKSLANAIVCAGIGLLASALLLNATPASAAKVGYYNISSGQGEPFQVPAIEAAGHTPVKLTSLSAAELASVDVVFVVNPSNLAYSVAYDSALPAITTAVNNGLVLCFAGDRHVTTAATHIPGGSNISFERDPTVDGPLPPVPAPSRNIDIADDTTPVTHGPGGDLSDTNLDGGNHSNHGFATASSLPAGNRVILIRAPNEAVTFSYPQGNGAVVYSTIPVDFYINLFGLNPPRDAFRNIYAPNVVDYCASLAEHSSLGPINLRFCHSADHSGPAACKKNGLDTTGGVATQSLPPSGCAPGEPQTGSADVGIDGNAITFTWANMNCGNTADGSESFRIKSVGPPHLMGTVLEMKAEDELGNPLGLWLVPGNEATGIGVDDPSVNGSEKKVISGNERLIIKIKDDVDDVFVNAAAQIWVGKRAPPQKVIVKAFLDGIQVGEIMRELSAANKSTHLSELQVFSTGDFGNKPFDELRFSAGVGSAFGLRPVFFNTTHPVSP